MLPSAAHSSLAGLIVSSYPITMQRPRQRGSCSCDHSAGDW